MSALSLKDLKQLDSANEKKEKYKFGSVKSDDNLEDEERYSMFS